MAKIKLTKGELKRQRDALRQFERYLPTLQLKKQQLQLEILQQLSLLDQRQAAYEAQEKRLKPWLGLLSEQPREMAAWLRPVSVETSFKNIAGVDIPVFGNAVFAPVEYDLFATPLWVDGAIEMLRQRASLREELGVIRQGVDILRRELRTTAQRVNLFEKVKIPETKESIRLIKIFIGDQMANAVGRSKIAKAKIQAYAQEEAAV
jgi:V/A-type H+/Na+-transporting ATPase subunit D